MCLAIFARTRLARDEPIMASQEKWQFDALPTDSLVSLFCTPQDWTDPAIIGHIIADTSSLHYSN